MPTLQDLIAQGEHQEQDFKFRIDDARKIARTMVAFANTDGGRLLIGVKDNRKIVGIDSEEELYVAEMAATLYSKPELDFRTKLWYEGTKTVLEVYVPPSANKPHEAQEDDGKWMAYLRQGDHNFKANRVVMRLWQSEFKKRPTQLIWTHKQKWLFDYLREHGEITISKLVRKGKVKRFNAEIMLANLVRWDILNMDISERGCHFSLSERVNVEGV